MSRNLVEKKINELSKINKKFIIIFLDKEKILKKHTVSEFKNSLKKQLQLFLIEDLKNYKIFYINPSKFEKDISSFLKGIKGETLAITFNEETIEYVIPLVF